MDGWTKDFITDHPDATVFDLGAGLDSRVVRIDPPSEGRWYDVAFPDVIELLQPALSTMSSLFAAVLIVA